MRTLAFAAGLLLLACQPAKSPHNEELQQLRDADQAARKQDKPDFSGDPARRARVLEMVAAGTVKTGVDHCNAALVMQHGVSAEDFLLAHELAVAALALGNADCKWLAAASEDRFLGKVGLKQRFGTQFLCDVNGQCRLAPVAEGVTDSLRAVLAVPPLADSGKRASALSTPLTTGSAGSMK